MKANLLGDIRAEADHEMLKHAFIETPDYKTLLSFADRSIVVGRRGSGKSALVYALARHWRDVPKTVTITLSPAADQVLGLRPLINRFGKRFNLLRAASRLAWKYGLMMEIAVVASQHFKFRGTQSEGLLRPHIERWRKEVGLSHRLRSALITLLPKNDSEEEAIGELASRLEVNQIQAALIDLIPQLKTSYVVMVDKLDEGWEADEVGTGLVDGLVLATVDLNDHLPQTRVTTFLRDNIARAVARADPDYSRDIEGQVLRLHWDEPLLKDMACSRLRSAFGIEIEKNTKLWDRCTGSNLHGADGFRQCLRLTLYRPRDILVLLNQAFYRAAGQKRSQIVLADIRSTAQEISQTRLDDLHKEYSQIIPGLTFLTAAFADAGHQLAWDQVFSFIKSAVEAAASDDRAKQHFEILGTPNQIALSLYSIGFLGLRDTTSGTFIFCHDGRSPDREISDKARMLIHPCYWLALGVVADVLGDTEAEEIFDDYEITVVSTTPEIRRGQLGQHIAALQEIPSGSDGAKQFEDWCLKAARILFPGQLSNIELHPNRNAVQRRDIVATNLAERGVWRRIYEDYKTRQVVFEIKNKQDVDASDFRQVQSYLTGEYGKCGFVVTRENSVDLHKGTDLTWVKELYDKHDVLVLKLTGQWFSKLLSKLRNPQKHDEADRQLNGLLDTYTRLYLSGQVPADRKKSRRRK